MASNHWRFLGCSPNKDAIVVAAQIKAVPPIHSLSWPRELDPLPKSRRGALQIRRKHLLQSLPPSTSTHELLHKVFRQQHRHCYSAAAEPVPVPITSFLVTFSMRPLEQEHCSLCLICTGSGSSLFLP